MTEKERWYTAARNLENYIATADPLIYELDPHDDTFHKGKLRLTLNGGIMVMAKPVEGLAEPEYIKAGIDGYRAIHCEVGAYLIARELGFIDLVPTTVRRLLPTKYSEKSVCSVQVVLADVIENAPYDDVPPSDVLRAAVLDYLIENTDRKHRNWLVRKIKQGDRLAKPRLVLIDHSFCLGFQQSKRGFNSKFYEEMQGEELSGDIIQALRRFVEQAPQSELPDILPDDSFTDVMRRAEQLLELRRLPERQHLLVGER